MSCYCDYDPCDIWDEKTRVARKRWACYECGEPIEIGDEYTDIAQLYEGSWDHFRICDCCTEDWENLVNAGHCKLLGELQETLESAY